MRKPLKRKIECCPLNHLTKILPSLCLPVKDSPFTIPQPLYWRKVRVSEDKEVKRTFSVLNESRGDSFVVEHDISVRLFSFGIYNKEDLDPLQWTRVMSSSPSLLVKYEETYFQFSSESNSAVGCSSSVV